ncbi:Fungal-specific transcription factor protein [Penicillium frequentans]|uniref:Fungal-specific transcription factor protein n=1 Tax=Penicillium frequentans TaxID=3151616 RepID=A0AAD6D4F5_9EURO|nr:Fungal-specific transcription factor protein [Penicillium glabrum]
MQETTSSQRVPSTPARSTGDSPAAELPLEENLPEVAPSPSDYGSIRIQESGVSYVSSSHWAAVLDSIAELRDHLEQDVKLRETITYDPNPHLFPSPQLLYSGGCAHVTIESILESIPPRPVVDRLIARYFNDLDMASGVPHTGKFLREYEEFWKSPHETPVVWIGLLFSMMCLSTQVQDLFLDAATPKQPRKSPNKANIFREKIIQCLILGHYTEGGPHVLETLSLYLMTEIFPSKDTAPGIRILVSTIITIATQMGYHLDAKHFSNISAFTAEMRRRMWALIVQMDFNISMQMGLARIIKSSQSDVAEPRNLFDSDFDESSSALPPSRPESENTPTLYTLAKIRLVTVGAEVADAATEPRICSYKHVLEVDELIEGYRVALPASMRWRGLESSLSVPAQVIIKSIWLEVCVQRLKIVLHKRFFVATQSREHQGKYPYSHSTCLKAATNILELQHLIDEETQPDGRLYQTRWRVSASLIHDFLLATSLLCFYLQNRATAGMVDHPGADGNDHIEIGRIKHLLKLSQIIWLRESDASQEVRKAVSALHYVLGDPDEIGHHGLIMTSQCPPEMMPADFLNLDFSFADEEILGQKFSQVDDEPWDGDWQMET